MLITEANQALKETLLRLGHGQFDDFILYEKNSTRSLLPQLTAANVLAVAAELAERGEILVTSYVNPVLADELIKAGVEFYDCCGNVYLRSERGIFCYVGAKNKAKMSAVRLPAGEAFQPTGLKVVFTLLTQDFQKTTYRKIQDYCGVSLGAVKKAVDDLVRQGFLLKDRVSGKMDWTLRRRDELIDQWAEFYRLRLRNKLLVKRFRAKKSDWWLKDSLKGSPAQWGGEVAAYQLEKAVMPEVKTIYQFGNINRIIAQNRLEEDPEGDVELLEAFWPFDEQATVHPLVIYADLITSADSRNLEAARVFRELLNV